MKYKVIAEVTRKVIGTVADITVEADNENEALEKAKAGFGVDYPIVFSVEGSSTEKIVFYISE
jgi:hypothetical protein